MAHYPAGNSKYNPVERRLFSQITKNWAAEPLTDYDKILGLIRNTTTTTGLKVRAYLDTKDYPLKVKPSAQRLRELRITKTKSSQSGTSLLLLPMPCQVILAPILSMAPGLSPSVYLRRTADFGCNEGGSSRPTHTIRD